MPSVIAVAKDDQHRFSKATCSEIRLIKGQGVEGDAHAGETVKHRSRVKVDPTQPNLRQVHLIQVETIETLQASGFTVAPAVMGENITTRDIDLLGLPRGTVLKINHCVIEITGLRNPCGQLDGYQKGLTAALLDKTADGELIRKAGIMGIVLEGGTITPGDEILVELPPEPHHALERV